MRHDPDDRTDAVRRYLDAFATGDPDAVAACVTVDFVNEHQSELGSGCTGRDEYRRRLAGFLAAFAGLRYEVLDVVADASADGPVVARYRMYATHDGHAIEIPGVMWFEVRDGLVARRTDLWDSLTFLRQTGQAD